MARIKSRDIHILVNGGNSGERVVIEQASLDELQGILEGEGGDPDPQQEASGVRIAHLEIELDPVSME